MKLPAAFQEQMCRLLGEEDAESLFSKLETEAVTSIRLNLGKCSRVEHFERPVDAVPWSVGGYYLSRRPAYTFDPLFHAGAYYVQEPSSMFVAQALKRIAPSKGARVLDLCAAPGGKSTLLRGLLPEHSLLVSNEPLPSRAGILVENMSKWGHPDCVVTQNYPADFAPLGAFFDVVLADVPCSGEGMFRKDADAVGEWSPDAVERCSARQREIIASVWPALKTGGYLIYSTCTYNKEEDEENVDWICRHLDAEVVPIPVEADWGITGSLTHLTEGAMEVYHFFPHRLRGEGFFLALLRKRGEETATEGKRNKARKGKGNGKTPPVPSAVKTWLADSSCYEYRSDGKGGFYAVAKEWADAAARLSECLHVLSCGVPLGEERGRNLLPHAALAFSEALGKDAFPHASLNYGQAVAFLRGETLTLSSDTPRGVVLVSFRGLPLGFVKNLGVRANNLYPSKWRIRSGYVPTEPSVV